MIEPLRSQLMGSERPPFESGGRRLRVTVYCPQAGELSADDIFRLGLLKELAGLDYLRVVGTDTSMPWHLEVDPTPNENGCGVVVFVGPEGPGAWHALYPSDRLDRAVGLLGIGSPTDPQTCALTIRLPLIEAHQQTGRDLFITSYQPFLALEKRLPRANIKDLREGLRIVGLYLRSVGDHVPISRHYRFERRMFYWVLCRHRLPAMWRYFSACLERGRSAHDHTDYLGNTILDRCVRVLQARDEAGFRFYRRQSNSTRDEMLYHFDYLTIMLSGALDAQARVARRTYGIARIKSRTSISFRNMDFRKAIRSERAHALADVLESPEFLAFQKFLGALRNSVHSIGLRGLGVSRGSEPQSSLVSVFEDEGDVWDASGALGSREDLGVTHAIGVAVEPYTCAVRLAELGLKYVNAIAETTDTDRLLPSGITADQLRTRPPDDRIFGADVRSRIDALG